MSRARRTGHDGQRDQRTGRNREVPDVAGSAAPNTPERLRGNPGRPTFGYSQIPPEIAESLRSIVGRHELQTGQPLPHSIAVTSALAGEGVTTVSQALATIIAEEMGRFVCWIDFDWLNPDVGSEDADRPSLLEMLSDHSRITSAFESTPDTPQLVTLSPGPVPEGSRNRIVRSPEFGRLLGVLEEEFDHLVFDLPPLLTSANTLALVGRADASILVVQHRSTSLGHVQRAIDAMAPTPNLAIVLNRFRPSAPRAVRRLIER